MRYSLLAAALLFAAPAYGAGKPAAAKPAFNPCAADKSDYVPIAKRSAHAVFYRLQKCGEPESFLFGSIHSDDAGARGRAAEAFAVLPNIAAAGFEYLEPEDAAEIAARTMFDPRPDAKLSAKLSKEEWTKLKARLVAKRQLTEAAIQRLKPWAAAVMLQVPNTRRQGEILDEQLRQHAKAQNARLFGLETMQEQLAIFDHMSEARQWAMLKDTLANIEAVDAMNAKLLRAYTDGDLGEIERLGDRGFAEIKDESLRQYLLDALIIKRNARMAEQMQLEMSGEPVLTVVGALHLPGKEGILQRLERAGYYLFPVERATDAARPVDASGKTVEPAEDQGQ